MPPTAPTRRGALAFLGAAGAATAASAAPAGQALPDEIAATVERAFRPLLARHDVPGMAVAVTAGGRRAHFAFGIASRETGAPVTADTIFEIGSVSKVFTATLLAHAVATGAASLDDRVGDRVPELAGAPICRASLLDLCTYTAGGLPLQFPDGVGSDAEAMAYYRGWRPTDPPGTRRVYSNPSIALLGLALERALGRDFTDVAERDLFPGLGLADTRIRVPASEAARYALGTDRAGRPIRLRPGVFAAAAWGIKTTASDLIGFVEAQLDPGRLAPAFRDAVRATQLSRVRAGPIVQGLGWELSPWPVPLGRLFAGNASEVATTPQPATRIDPPASLSPALLGKTGSTNGFGAYVAAVPARGIGLAMLANRALPIPARIEAAHVVLETLAG